MIPGEQLLHEKNLANYLSQCFCGLSQTILRIIWDHKHVSHNRILALSTWRPIAVFKQQIVDGHSAARLTILLFGVRIWG